MEIDLRNSLSLNGVFERLAISSVEKRKIDGKDRQAAIVQIAYNFQQITFNATTIGIVAAAVFATFSYLSIPVSGLMIGTFWLTRQIIVADINNQAEIDLSEDSEEIRSAMEQKGVFVPREWNAVAYKIIWPFNIVLLRNTIQSEKPNYEKSNYKVRPEYTAQYQ
ncbi:MAG: hypothetical protein K2X08_04640 [Chlamydiales bacterium]|nr:hypothetical protein [Chlamydiales bacterium]